MKLRFSFLALLLMICFVGMSQQKQRIKVACVGNSITQGVGVKNQHKDSYPGVLQQLLGDDYEVGNFGYSGRTLQNSCENPYMKERLFHDALDFNPDIVTIKLGTNDSRYSNWVNEKAFRKDMETLVKAFKKLPSKPKIYLCLPVPSTPNRYEIIDSILYNNVIPVIRKVAKKKKLALIDLYTPFVEHPEYFPDHVHPSKQGAVAIAREMYKGIKGTEAPVYEEQEFMGDASDFLIQLKPTKVASKKYDFVYKGKTVTVFTPTEKIANGLWIWHPYAYQTIAPMDKYMMGSGYHVVYAEDPSIIKLLKNNYGFSDKMVIDDTFSNMKWLRRNTDKVACYINSRKQVPAKEAELDSLVRVRKLPSCMSQKLGFLGSADFAIRHQPEYQKMQKIRRRASLSNSYLKFTSADTVKVGFIGSATVGMNGWKDLVRFSLSKQFPNTVIEYFMTDTLGANSKRDAQILETEIKQRGGFDLLFIDETANDCDTLDWLTQTSSMDRIIRSSLEANIYTDIIMLHTPTHHFVKLASENLEPDSKLNLERVANYYHISSIDMIEEVAGRIAKKEFSWNEYMSNKWPNLGLNFTARTVLNFLEKEWAKPNEAPVEHYLPEE